MKSPVEMVHRQLEYLKYIGGTIEQLGKDGKIIEIPTGQGIEISIVVLPDLLLDVRSFHFNTKKPVFAVGGRAARIACALLHMLGEDDGTYYVYLLTKTGNLGRLLLEDEFKIGASSYYFSNPFLEYINSLQRKGQPRCAIRSNVNQPVASSKVTKFSELKKDDLEKSDVAQIIKKASAVCLTSLNTPHFHNLFDTLLTNVSNQCLFLDSRMSTDPHQAMRSLVSQLHKKIKLDKNQLNKIVAIFLRYDQETAFCQAAKKESLGPVCNDLQISILKYGGPEVQLWIPNRAGPIQIPSNLKVQQEGVSEYFKAGVLLAWSTWKSVLMLKEKHKKIYERLVYEWISASAKDDCWPTILKYATDIANTRQEIELPYCTLEKVIQNIRKNEKKEYGSIHLPITHDSFDPKILPLKVDLSSKSQRHLIIDNDVAPLVLAELAGRRRISSCEKNHLKTKVSNALAYPKLALCEPSYCPNCVKAKRKSPIAAVMIDLDGTLMNSTEQRDRGLVKALAVFNDTLTLSDRIKFFTKNVYKHNNLFKAVSQKFTDVRQKWNHPAWYIVYLMLTRDKKLEEEAHSWSERVEKTKNVPLNKDEKAQLKTWGDSFLASYRRIETDEEELINKAVTAFENVQLYPFKEARDFLQSLRLTGSFELYIVSEGDPETQWIKLRKTGLDRFFNREHLLTTGDAIHAVGVLRTLQEEREMLAVEKADINAHCKRLSESMKEKSDFISDILKYIVEYNNNSNILTVITKMGGEEQIRIANQIQALNKQFNKLTQHLKVIDFVKRVIARMEQKSFLYAGAIRAILRNSASPRSQLRHFDLLMEPLSPNTKLKFAMIGDRQTKDIQPPADLLREKIITIRLQALDYAIDPIEKAAELTADLAPQFIADTLAETKAILLNKDVWNSLRCASDPPLFNCNIEIATSHRNYYPEEDDKEVYSIGLDYIECGCMMFGRNFRMTRRICAGIMVEHLVKCSEEDRKNIFNNYLSSESSQRPSERERAALLCSLIRAGLLSQDILEEWQVQIVKELDSDLNLIRSDKQTTHEVKQSDHDSELESEIRSALEHIARDGIKEAKKEVQGVLKLYDDLN